jgi:MFS family permease
MVTSNTQSNIPALVCVLLASLTTGGTMYAFGVYGNTLKKSLLLSQSQLDTISSSFFVAGVFSWIPGLVVDKFGPRISLILGGIMGALSTTLFWAMARQFFSAHDHIVEILTTLGVLISLACALIIASVFKIIMTSCKDTKGHAVGVAKAHVGLGAGVYVCIFSGLTHSSDLDYLPMCAFFFLTCVTLPAIILLPTGKVNYRDDATPYHYRILYVSLLILGIMVLWNTTRLLLGDLRDGDQSLWSVCGILFVWLVPIMSLLYIPRKVPAKNQDEEALRLIEEQQQSTAEDTNYNLVQMLKTQSAYLMLWTCTIVVGSGLVETNNMGQMVESLRFSDAVTPASLALFSVCQAVSRVVAGTFSDAMAHRGVSRPFFLIVASLIAFFSHLILSITTTEPLFVFGVALSGIAFGAVWPLMVLIVGEVFGETHLGGNYMFYDGCTGSIGAFVLSNLVAGQVYEHNSSSGGGSVLEEDSYTCYGPSCFRMTHVCIAALSLTAIATSIALCRSTRNAYSKYERIDP